MLEFGRKNEAKFERIFELYNQTPDAKLKADIIAKQIHLSYIQADREFDFCLIVGGVLAKEIGFMRALSKEDMPQIL